MAFALVAGWTLTILASLAYMRTLVRPYQRREDVLLDRLAHMSGRPWTPPPTANGPVEEEIPVERYVRSPEQFPDY